MLGKLISATFNPGEISCLILLTILLSASCSDLVPDHGQFAAGMTRDEVLKKFGKPLSTHYMTKSGKGVMGAIEDYWHKIPDGAKVEIWIYHTVNMMESPEGNHRQDGQTELYFINDSDRVNEIGFSIEGAIYEDKVEIPIF